MEAISGMVGYRLVFFWVWIYMVSYFWCDEMGLGYVLWIAWVSLNFSAALVFERCPYFFCRLVGILCYNCLFVVCYLIQCKVVLVHCSVSRILYKIDLFGHPAACDNQD
jgi:hypothetical protein